MKIKIKNFNGELPDYLTVGEVYEVSPSYGFDGLYDLVDDTKDTLNIDIDDCVHLNGGSWEIINE